MNDGKELITDTELVDKSEVVTDVKDENTEDVEETDVVNEVDSDEADELTEEEIEKEKIKKRKRRSLLKLNLVSLFFTAVSFISVTLAWFAYSGLVTTQTEVDVKAWYIEFNKQGTAVSNNIVISLDDVYPGMDIMSEVIDIKNSGDSTAMIDYKIKSVRILDDEYEADDTGKLEDELSHKYPFHINMALSNRFANAKVGTGKFTVSVSWPLDSESGLVKKDGVGDAADTSWGTKAYEFQKNEADALAKDSSYQVRASIEIVISLEAVQYIGEGNAPDTRYPLGKKVLYNPIDNVKCDSLVGNCITTYVIDKNNTVADADVTLIPDLSGNASTSSYSDYDGEYNSVTSDWTVTHTRLGVKHLVPVIANDIISSVMVGSDVSNQLIGFVDYGDDKVDSVINDTIAYNGYIRFKNEMFPYFSSSTCVWLDESYGSNKQFALVKADELYSKIYPSEITNDVLCKAVPVITVSKNKLN